jgi:hypothetical protein
MMTNLTPKATGLIAELQTWMTLFSQVKDDERGGLTTEETKELLDCVMRVQAFISYANRENSRLVRERDAANLRADISEHFTRKSV